VKSWKEVKILATSSIFDTFVIDSDEIAEKLIQEKPEEEKRKTPKIDIIEKIEQGKKVLKNFWVKKKIKYIVSIYDNHINSGCFFLFVFKN